jgi:hypothetical protein
LGLADRDIASVEFTSSQTVPEMLTNLYGNKGRLAVQKQAKTGKFDIDASLSGSHINISELIAIRMFTDELTYQDNVAKLYDAIVIHNSDIEAEWVRIENGELPMLVQLDARYHLIWHGKRFLTSDIYQTLAYFLAIICLFRKGKLFPTLPDLRNTILTLCGLDIKEL